MWAAGPGRPPDVSLTPQQPTSPHHTGTCLCADPDPARAQRMEVKGWPPKEEQVTDAPPTLLAPPPVGLGDSPLLGGLTPAQGLESSLEHLPKQNNPFFFLLGDKTLEQHPR